MYLTDGCGVAASGFLRNSEDGLALFPPHAAHWPEVIDTESVGRDLVHAVGVFVHLAKDFDPASSGDVRSPVSIRGIWDDSRLIREARVKADLPNASPEFDLSLIDTDAIEWLRSAHREGANTADVVDLFATGAIISLIAIQPAPDKHGHVATIDVSAPGGDTVVEALRSHHGRSIGFILTRFDKRSIDHAFDVLDRRLGDVKYPIGYGVDPDFQSRIRFGIERTTPELSDALELTTPGLVVVEAWLNRT